MNTKKALPIAKIGKTFFVKEFAGTHKPLSTLKINQ